MSRLNSRPQNRFRPHTRDEDHGAPVCPGAERTDTGRNRRKRAEKKRIKSNNQRSRLIGTLLQREIKQNKAQAWAHGHGHSRTSLLRVAITYFTSQITQQSSMAFGACATNKRNTPRFKPERRTCATNAQTLRKSIRDRWISDWTDSKYNRSSSKHCGTLDISSSGGLGLERTTDYTPIW